MWSEMIENLLWSMHAKAEQGRAPPVGQSPPARGPRNLEVFLTPGTAWVGPKRQAGPASLVSASRFGFCNEIAPDSASNPLIRSLSNHLPRFFILLALSLPFPFLFLAIFFYTFLYSSFYYYFTITYGVKITEILARIQTISNRNARPTCLGIKI